MRNADLKRYAKLYWQMRAKESEVEELKKKLANLGESLIQNMTQDGVKRATIDGSTIHVKRVVRASAGGQMPVLVAAFKEAVNDPSVLERYPMLASMVNETINGNTLSAWVREHDPDNELAPEEVVAKLPEVIRPAIKVTEKWEIGCRKG